MQPRYPLNFQLDRFTRSGGGVYSNTIAATSNRLTAESGPTARTYTYDAAGNPTGNGQDTYTYYNSGRLKQITRAGTNIYSLQYNGLGQLVNRPNNNTRYVYDEAGHLLGEYNTTGDAVKICLINEKAVKQS